MRRAVCSFVKACLVFALLCGLHAELMECIDHAPRTYSDSEILDHTQKCLSMPSKYEVSYR